MGTEAEDDLKAFLSEASDPFRWATKPDAEEMDVPGVIKEDEDPLLNFPSLGRSSGRSV